MALKLTFCGARLRPSFAPSCCTATPAFADLLLLALLPCLDTVAEDSVSVGIADGNGEPCVLIYIPCNVFSAHSAPFSSTHCSNSTVATSAPPTIAWLAAAAAHAATVEAEGKSLPGPVLLAVASTLLLLLLSAVLF